jgi:hypothetical protein
MILIQIQNEEKLKKWMKHSLESHYVAGKISFSPWSTIDWLNSFRWKRVTIIRAITRTGVRGDVSYYAPCGRKLRSFQEIDRVCKNFLFPTEISFYFCLI